jgi:predicted transcriptional regulator
MSPIWEDLQNIKQEIGRLQMEIARLEQVNQAIDSSEEWGRYDIAKNISRIHKLQGGLKDWQEVFDKVKQKCAHLQVVK